MRPSPLAVAVAALAVLLASCAGTAPVSPAEVQAVERGDLPTGPDDPAWSEAPVFRADLILQDLVEPRLLEPSTTSLGVQAVTDGRRVAFRLSWKDPVADDLPGASRFSDACAVQLPRRTEADVPAPQMGEPGRPVEITYWRASWQASVDGRPDDIRALYPGATVDHYPFEAASLEEGSEEQTAMALRYAPARALGHAMEGPRDRPVEDLVAEGPGTLSPAPEGRSQGAGRRAHDGWEVVIVRDLPEGLVPGGRSQVAFAVWSGDHQEAGSRKMRTAWVPLAIGGDA